MLPSRPLRPDERKLVEEWLASAGDVVSAYISERRTDDPATYRQIVITIEGDGEPSYFIDTPSGTNYWIVAQPRPFPDVHKFDSLREALMSSPKPVIRPLWLGESDSPLRFQMPTCRTPPMRPGNALPEKRAEPPLGGDRVAARRAADQVRMSRS
jgi:hypothetical protein